MLSTAMGVSRRLGHMATRPELRGIPSRVVGMAMSNRKFAAAAGGGKKKVPMDGNECAAYVATALSESLSCSQACYTCQLSPWSSCISSVGSYYTCGTGVKTQTATCINSATQQAVTPSTACGTTCISSTLTCSLGSCPYCTVGAWSACTATSTYLTCGATGTQYATGTCYSNGQIVSATLCGSCATQTRACSLVACPTTYTCAIGAWSTCLSSTGSTCGTSGVQTTTLQCLSNGLSPVDISFCSGRCGASTRSCSLVACPQNYMFCDVKYGTCTSSTGSTCDVSTSQPGGSRSITRVCYDPTGAVTSNDACSTALGTQCRASDTETCSLGPCGTSTAPAPVYACDIAPNSCPESATVCTDSLTGRNCSGTPRNPIVRTCPIACIDRQGTVVSIARCGTCAPTKLLTCSTVTLPTCTSRSADYSEAETELDEEMPVSAASSVVVMSLLAALLPLAVLLL